MERARAELFSAFVDPQRRKFRTREPGRIFQNRPEHRREVGGRTADDAEYSRRRSLPLERGRSLGVRARCSWHDVGSWEGLRQALQKGPRARHVLGVEETEIRAQFLGVALCDLSRTVDEALKLHSQIECLLRTLLRKRSAGTLEFNMLSRRRDSRVAQVESLSLEAKQLAEIPDDSTPKIANVGRPSRAL